MNKKEIIKDLTLFLGNIEGARTISSSDFTDDRIPFMIVVGVETVTQVYPSLPDYELKLNILVDTFITDDEDGEKFNKIITTIENKLTPYFLDFSKLSVIFPDVPAVGFILESKDTTITSTSNMCEFKINLYTSYTSI